MLQHLCQGKGPASQTRNRNDTPLHLSAYCYSHLKYTENGSKEEWDIGWTWELEYTGDHNKMNRLEWTNRKEQCMGTGNKLLKCSGGTRILQFMVETNIFNFIRRPLIFLKDHMVLGWATMTSWYYFTHAWIDELHFWAFTFKGAYCFKEVLLV